MTTKVEPTETVSDYKNKEESMKPITQIKKWIEDKSKEIQKIEEWATDNQDKVEWERIQQCQGEICDLKLEIRTLKDVVKILAEEMFDESDRCPHCHTQPDEDSSCAYCEDRKV